MTDQVNTLVEKCLNQITLADRWNESFFKEVLKALFIRIGIELIKIGVHPRDLITTIYANTEAVSENITKNVVNKIER